MIFCIFWSTAALIPVITPIIFIFQLFIASRLAWDTSSIQTQISEKQQRTYMTEADTSPDMTGDVQYRVLNNDP